MYPRLFPRAHVIIPPPSHLLVRRHKAPQNVWRDQHEAAVLMRAAALVYPKAAAGGMDRSDEAETRSSLGSLLELATERACQPGVMRQMEGGAARRLLAAAAHLGCTVPRVLSGAILTEMVRDSGDPGSRACLCS